jgi:hypothetical protein
MASELNGWARSRPLRIAFLVEDGEHASLALDGIFADCYYRWGGRFSLIAPCVNGRISATYWPWLEAYDADIVYSYVPLSRADVLEVHERLAPAHYYYHELGPDPRLDVFGFKPSYDFSPLSSLSVVFKLARYSPAASGSVSVKIIDSWHTESPSRFLTDNFGTYHVSQGGGMYPRDATVAASLLTIVAPEKQVGRFGVPRDLNAIPTEIAAFIEFAHRRAISLSLASTLFAQKLDVRVSRWSGSFNLVVGDSFADRILFWNARLMIPNWLDNELCCLRVNLDQLKQSEFLSTLGELLKHRNYVNSGSGGQPQLAIRSVSLTTVELAEALRLVGSTKPWSATRAEPVTGMDDIVPPLAALKAAKEGIPAGEASSRGWARFLWVPPTARLPAIVPDHLSDAPVRQVFTEGYWCNDVTLEYDGPGSRFRNENRWMLPSRWRVTGAFKTSLVDEPQFGAPLSPRRNRDGNLSVTVSSSHPVETIKVPTAYEALQYALAVDGARADPNAQHGRIYPPNKVVWAHPSNEARYLAGVLGMTDGLERASQLLLHPFLRDMFASFGGTPNLPSEKMVPRARFEAVFDLKSEPERHALAELIVKAAQSLTRPIDFVSYNELRDSWKAYRAAYWIANRQPGADTEVDWDKREAETLNVCLVGMRRRQMIFQGHRWTCRKCHHRNWIDLAELSSELTCEVCKQSEQAPVDIQWLFRPNEFLIECLRDHSVLSLVWTLSQLRERSRWSFIFVEPTWFGYTFESTAPAAEADLLVILDGEPMLCEVKSSWRSLRLSHLVDFVALAIRLRPSIALLAVMENGSALESEMASARVELAAENIKFELLTPAARNLEDGPLLYSDDES